MNRRHAAAVVVLTFAACASPSRRLQSAVDAENADRAAQIARQTPTLDGERTLDVALREAAKLGRPKLVAELIARGATPNSGKGLTPLMEAAWHGHATTCEALLAHGADANQATRKFRRTALMYAARFGNEDTVRALLAGGADARAIDWRGRDAAGYARESAHVDLLPLLVGAAETSAAPTTISPTPSAAPAPAAESGDDEE